MRRTTEGVHQSDAFDPTPDHDDLEMFGVDPEGPLPEAEQEVLIPDTLCPLTDTERQHFLQQISLLQQDREYDHRIRVFCGAKLLLNEILHDSTSSNSD